MNDEQVTKKSKRLTPKKPGRTTRVASVRAENRRRRRKGIESARQQRRRILAERRAAKAAR